MIFHQKTKKKTFKKRTGRSPLVLACGSDWTSLTFVRKASLPSLLQANQVPPAKPSLPPKISPPSHHARGSVGLSNCHNQKRKPNLKSLTQLHYWPPQPKSDPIQCKKQRKSETNSPTVIFVPVEQEKERVNWVSSPQKHRYTHVCLAHWVAQKFFVSITFPLVFRVREGGAAKSKHVIGLVPLNQLTLARCFPLDSQVLESVRKSGR